MMIGLVTTEVKLVKKDLELVQKIIEKRSYTPADAEKIQSMLRYNVWTTKQFSKLTGLAVSTITNLTLPRYNEKNELGTSLNFCYPFQDMEGEGPKFIVRDEKSEKYLLQ